MGCPFDICDGSGFVVDEETNTASDCRCRAAAARPRPGAQPVRRRSRAATAACPSIARRSPTSTRRSLARCVATSARSGDSSTTGRGLWFMGDVGTGKTTLAMLVSKAALDAGRSVAIYSLPRLLAEIRSTYDDERRAPTRRRRCPRLSAPTVDLARTSTTLGGASATSDWVLEQLYSIVNSRYEDERAIVITTNLEPDELREQIGERTVSRLIEMCGDPLPLFGPDRRVERSAACSGASPRPLMRPPSLRRACRDRHRRAPNGATRERGRSPTCSPSRPTPSSASRAATTPATRSSAATRSGSST